MIKADIKNGQFIIYNEISNVTGIELHYKGTINITPTLPEGWFLRAGNSKIIIVSLGSNVLTENVLFKFEGKLKINVAFAATKEQKKHLISIKNTQRNWNSNYFLNGSLDSIQDNWDTIKNTNVSKPKTNVRFGNNSSYNSNEKGNTSIVNVPTENNLYTKGGEYMLNQKEYVGNYHIHSDIGVAMTGKRHSKSSKMLSTFTNQTIQKTSTQRTLYTPPNTTTTTTSGSGGY